MPPPCSRNAPRQWGSLRLCCASDSPYPSCKAEVRTTLLRFAGCLFPCLVLHHCTYSFFPRAFLQGFLRLPGTVTGLFNMAAEQGRELESGCDIVSQVSSVIFNAKFHFFAFPTSKQGLWFFYRKGFMWLNPSNFTSLPVVWEVGRGMVQWQCSLIPLLLPRFSRHRCGHSLNENRGEKPYFWYFLPGMAVVNTQSEDMAEEERCSWLFLLLAMVLVCLGLCKWGFKELERKGIKGNWWHRGAVVEGCYSPSSAEALWWESFPTNGRRKMWG